MEKRERQLAQQRKREQRRRRKLAKKFMGYEPEQRSHHDLREHFRFGGTMDDYLD